MDNRLEAKDGVIVDNSTGLMWMQKPLEGKFIFWEACELKHEFAGYSDWRLPIIEELISILDYKILDYKKDKSACNEVFRFGKGQIFWSSSPDVGDPDYALYVNFDYGHVYNGYRNRALSVRLVRG